MNDQIVTINSHIILITEEDTGKISFQYPADFDIEGFDVLEVGFVSEATMLGFAAYTLMPPSGTITGFDFIGEYTDLDYATQRVLTKLKFLHGTGFNPLPQRELLGRENCQVYRTQDNQLTITLTNDD